MLLAALTHVAEGLDHALLYTGKVKVKFSLCLIN
jgi:hypothetical protein